MATEAKLITARTVRELLGGCSDMFIWRRLNEATSDFPKPIVIAKRRYWREQELVAWIEAQAERTAA